MRLTNWIAAGAALAVVFLAPALGPTPAYAQADDIEAESITEQGTLDPIVAQDSDLRPIFEEAERLFQSFEQPDSIPLFDRLIARLHSAHATEPLSEELLDMLIQSRSHRAEANFNLGESDSAARDLRGILELDPGWQVDPNLVSPKFVEMLEDLRSEIIGELLVLVEPIDARVELDGQEVAYVGQPTSVLTGTRTVRILRAGYEPVEETVEISAGKTATLDHILERTSSVARVRVRPAGTEIVVDGEPAQIAERVMLADESGEDVVLEGLTPGEHVIEVRGDEYRPRRMNLETNELDDYRLPPVGLDLKQGEIRLSELPEGATVDVDGERIEIRRSTAGTATLALPPGDHVVEIRKPGVGGFRERIPVGDQEIIDMRVELRPTIAFLGVLGSDRLAASSLAERLGRRLNSLSEWIWNDRSIDAPAVLDRDGLDTAELRRLAGLAGRRSAPDWNRIQNSFDDTFGASIYVLAVLGDDLYATTADLWLWSPAPWPAAPTLRTLSLQDDAELEHLAAAFDGPLLPSHPTVGARFIDSVSGAPVVSSVTATGPAAAAGLAAGDSVLSIAGQPVASVYELVSRLAEAAPGEAALTVGTATEPRELRFRVERGPGVIDLADSEIIDPVMAARLANELLREQPSAPRWLLQMNQAALYLRAMSYQDAVALLRAIEAPAGAGLSRAMVDYWLGSTLMTVDARLYANAARQALTRAVEQADARLYHADGPLLGPRARARLAQVQRLVGN